MAIENNYALLYCPGGRPCCPCKISDPLLTWFTCFDIILLGVITAVP